MKLYDDERITPADPHRRPQRGAGNAAPIYFDNPAWMDDAACASVGGDFWYPEVSKNGAINAAIRICQQCPVKAECLDYALDRNERIGIWGGTTVNERKAMRRERAA